MTTRVPSRVFPRRAIAAALIALLLAGCGGEAEVSTLVELRQTLLTGTRQDLPDGGTMIAWRGVPYGRAPRFGQPVPPRRRSALLEATDFGPACPQPALSLQETSDQPVSESCLFLNVFAPAEGGGRPVMVWFHGGRLETGSGDRSAALPERLVQQGVIVVTVNYRLGVLGYLAHPALTETSGTEPLGSGDYGLLDQIRALEWIRTNIAPFGGDPNNVTIFGQGAGGASVKAIMAAEGTENLFRRAIIQSGPIGPQETMGDAESRGQSFVDGADLCPDVENPEDNPEEVASCLLSLDVTELVQAQVDQGFETAITQRPGVLEQSVPDALAGGAFNGEQVLEGTTRDEYRLILAREQIQTGRDSLETRIQDSQQAYEDELVSRFDPVTDSNVGAVTDRYPLSGFQTADLAVAAVGTDSIFVCPALEQVRDISGQVPTYAYEFADRDAPSPLGQTLEDLPLGAARSTELAYLLDPASALTEKLEAQSEQPEQSLELADAMVRHWAAFARTGDPNPSDGTLPMWNTFADQGYQSLEAPPENNGPVDVGADHNCGFWAQQ